MSNILQDLVDVVICRMRQIISHSYNLILYFNWVAWLVLGCEVKVNIARFILSFIIGMRYFYQILSVDPRTGPADEKWISLFPQRTSARFIRLDLQKWAFLSRTWIPAGSHWLGYQCRIGWVPEIRINICLSFWWTFSSLCCLHNIDGSIIA